MNKTIKRPQVWSSNLLTNVILMYEPADAITNMKLHQVSKTFRRALKEVIPYQIRRNQLQLKEIPEMLHAIKSCEQEREEWIMGAK